MAFQHNMVPPTAQYGTKRQKKVVCEFPVAAIRVRIREGTVDHILEKHSKDFDFAIDGETYPPMIEYKVSQYIQEIISTSSQLFLSVARSTRADSIMMYFRRPQDKMHHCFPLAYEEDNCYRISTGYKKRFDEESFSGTWVQCGSQAVVDYWPGMMGVFTRESVADSGHYWNIHGRPMQQQQPMVYPVPLQPIYLVPMKISYVSHQELVCVQ
ncbi:hypothetical protein CRE_16155 [Caenorhabditis remanei]|uniref:Uncharacterized protein n=1 Tax=Caenorhabditis remanei TaxID=31234 RepID=E3MSJ7_CAERE|nr:hypothetical protein CRE_16155 [Caenorhabditis remanei]